KTKGSFTTANGQPLNVIGSYTASLRIGTNEVKFDVFVAVDLQHDCLIGLDYMGKVQGTRDKLKEIYSSLGGEEVVKDRKIKAVNRVEFSKEEQKRIDSFVSQKQLDELVETNIIEPRNSDWAAHLVPVEKKSGELRLNNDNRQMKKLTKKDRYRIPKLDNIYQFSKSLLSGNAENNHFIPEDLSPTSEVMPFRSNTED
ncbi:Retrovirus-related Pol poly from transposon, partial [Brachionus plicatilis]